MDGSELKIVSIYKFLGIFIADNLCNKEDILKCESVFLKQFYSLFKRFYHIDSNILFFLFKAHCLSFYGSVLWLDLKGCVNDFKSLSINFHKCIKKIAGVQWSANNHDLCEDMGILTFKHFINNSIISFFHNLINSKSACTERHKHYFLFSSITLKMLNKLFHKIYSITNVMTNDLDAVKSRIRFVEAREERRYFIPVYDYNFLIVYNYFILSFALSVNLLTTRKRFLIIILIAVVPFIFLYW